MAAVHQEPKVGREPNANSTPERRRNTNVGIGVMAVLLVIIVAALFAISRQPGAGMGGHISNQDSAPRTAPAQTP